VAFADPLPWWVLAPVVAAVTAVALLAYRGAALSSAQRGVLCLLRLVTLLLLVGLVMGPVVRQGSDLSNAVVPILVDASRSMSIADVEGVRRIDHARTVLTGSLLPALAPHFQIDVLAFGESLARATPEGLTASDRRSDLAGALDEVAARYSDRPVAGIVLLSDGGVTASTSPAWTGSHAAPVFPVGIGSAGLGMDREVLSVTALDAVLDDSRVDLAVSAVSRGQGIEPIELRLFENGRLADVRRARPASEGTPIREVFQVSPDASAPTVYTVEIPVTSGELVPENNVRSVLVQPPSRPRRVLLVQGAPGFEHSFLRRAWSADRGLEVDAIVRQGRNEQGADTFYIQAHPARSAALAAGFPATRADLFAYDAVVLANVDRALLASGDMEMLREFVAKKGGGILVLGARSLVGQAFTGTPLEDLLPLDPADRTRGVVPASVSSGSVSGVTLTAPGETHPMMQLGSSLEATRRRWSDMPALASVAPLGAPRPAATVLAVTPGIGGGSRPLVAVQRYGDGRTMLFTGEAAWRWRMRLPSDDRSYDTFWRQAIRWIALPAADPVALVLPEGAAPGEVLALRVLARTPAFQPLHGKTATLRVTRPDGRIDAVLAGTEGASGVDDGLLLARYRPEDPGVYRVTAEIAGDDGSPRTAAAWMLVGGVDHEMTDPRLNIRALQRVAAASGGQVIEPGEMTRLAGQLRAATPAAARRAQRDAWHNVWVLGAILLLLGGEWTLRRRWGLR
jgi:uncharacterized membrane protein